MFTFVPLHGNEDGWKCCVVRVILTVVFFTTVGVYVSLTSVVLVDLLGLEVLTSSFGLTLLFVGIAGVIGTPIAGIHAVRWLQLRACCMNAAVLYLSSSFCVLTGDCKIMRLYMPWCRNFCGETPNMFNRDIGGDGNFSRHQ